MNADLMAFGQVVLVDLVLAGDNAVVVGALAAGLPGHQRQTAIVAGIALAVVTRILLSIGVVWLLMIPYVMAFGGLLLFWVAWRMWEDIRKTEAEEARAPVVGALHKAILAIVAADFSMSLDNVLGVAGAANGHLGALAFGLLLSVVLMGVAASAIAGLINKHRWIAYVGLALIIFVAGRMLWHGIQPPVS